jgi:hypothetical protein
MSVVEAWTPTGTARISGTGYGPAGTVEAEEGYWFAPFEDNELTGLLACELLSSTPLTVGCVEGRGQAASVLKEARISCGGQTCSGVFGTGLQPGSSFSSTSSAAGSSSRSITPRGAETGTTSGSCSVPALRSWAPSAGEPQGANNPRGGQRPEPRSTAAITNILKRVPSNGLKAVRVAAFDVRLSGALRPERRARPSGGFSLREGNPIRGAVLAGALEEDQP